MTTYYLDTEFDGFGGPLISLALVGNNGRELYLATGCENPTPWVAQNVMPIVSVPGAVPTYVDPVLWGQKIAHFLRHDAAPHIVSDWPDDIRYFCETLITGPGMMVGIRHLNFTMCRAQTYPTTLPGAVHHNALWDARALRHVLTDVST